MFILRKCESILSFLSRGYEKYPRSFCLAELTLYSGIFAFHVWIVPFWFWGIHGLNIAVPKPLEVFFYELWRDEEVLPRVMVSMLGIGCFALSSLIRNDSLQELGIRLDNIRESARECVITSLVLVFMIMIAFIFYFDKFSPNPLVSYLIKFSQYYAPWGIIQQFLLQSVVLLSFLRIFGKTSIAVVSAAVLFALAHSPNMELMTLTFFFAVIGCVLFLRHRNIFTLGITHAFLAVFFSSLLVPGLVNDFKIGPWSGNPEFFAQIEYHGSKIKAAPSERRVIPIFVINKGKAIWDSKDKENPVRISYHLLDAQGEMMRYDNIRTPFNKMVRTDDSARVDLIVDAPPEKGEYYLEVDIVKEKVTWFKDNGTKTIRIPLSID